MPSAWNHSADRDLLLSIIDEGTLAKIDWHSVSAKLKTKGYEFTHEACRQHFQKIRRESASGVKANGSAPTTPSKRKSAAAGTPGTNLSARSSKVAQTLSEARDDSEESEESPTKKAKKAKKEETDDLGGFAGQNAVQFKQEWNNGDNPIDLENDDIYA